MERDEGRQGMGAGHIEPWSPLTFIVTEIESYGGFWIEEGQSLSYSLWLLC